jgi:hypothetical protein
MTRTSDRNRFATDKDEDANSSLHDAGCIALLAQWRAASLALRALQSDRVEAIAIADALERTTYLRPEYIGKLGVVVELESPIYAGHLSLPVCWADVSILLGSRRLIVEVKTSLHPTKENRAPVGATLRQLRLYKDLSKADVALAVVRSDGMSDDDIKVFEHHGFRVFNIAKWVPGADEFRSNCIGRTA